MLYISSRSKSDSFTAHRTLRTDRAPDGGVFIPYKIPTFTPTEMSEFKNKSFGAVVSQILNLFFSCSLTPWDVEICAGRAPVRMKEISQRLLSAECFYNPDRDYNYVESHIYEKLSNMNGNEKPTAWARIAIRIALLFAIYATVPSSIVNFDISVNTGDFSLPMAAWYARKMGLPVRTIICTTNDNGVLWDFIYRGELNTVSAFGKAKATNQVEGLVYHYFGVNGANELAMACTNKGTYRLSDEDRKAVSEGFAAAVVGADRVVNLIRSIYRTNNYFVTDAAAISYGGLQDYRAKTGESRYTLILMDSSPVLQASSIAAAVGVAKDDILKAF